MFDIFQDEDFIQIKIGSEIRNVNQTVAKVRAFLKQYGVRDESSIILVLRELLNNAIEHGNRRIKALRVIASIEHLGDMRFKIVVEDEGNGFDHKPLDLSIPEDPNQIRNRGLSLVNSFSDQLDFNEKGNCAIAYLSIKSETEFLIEKNVRDGIEWTIVKPTGDITAENAEKFRTSLLGLFENGCSKYRFDMLRVVDIDSVALSIFVIFSNMTREKFPDTELEITNTSHDIANLIRMTNLNEVYRLS